MFNQKESHKIALNDTTKVFLNCVCGSIIKTHTCESAGGVDRGLERDEDYLWLKGYFQKYYEESEWGRWIQGTLKIKVTVKGT